MAQARWRQLALLAVAQLLAMSVWFAGSVALPAFRSGTELTASQVGWLTSAVQLGFVAGTLAAAVLNLPDVLPARWYVATSALIAAVANAALLGSDSFGAALASRLVTGAALAGVYPPAMKMASTWFRDGRGLAIGAIVAALTIGKATPYLLAGADVTLEAAVLVPSAGALLAAIVIAMSYRDGPHAFPARAFSWRLIGIVVREPTLRRISGGYFGHMWELYAFWAWLPAYLAASAQASGRGGNTASWVFACIAIGAAGCLWGGWAADRIGRVQVVRTALIVSGVCCVLSAALFAAPFPVVLLLCLVWGIAVIADSAQFSALVTEHVPPHAVGTALTLQTSLGFLLTIASIQLVPVIGGVVGWRWAMVVLALGPVAGLVAVRNLAPLDSAAPIR